jgi:hypothetical protein
MNNPFAIKANFTFLESPFLVRQVQSHLVFGPVSRHLPLAYPLLGVALSSLLAAFLRRTPLLVSS